MQQGHQLRSHFPRPRDAFMLFAQEKSGSVADKNLYDNDQHQNSCPGKLGRFFSAVTEEPYDNKATEAATANPGKYPHRENTWVWPVQVSGVEAKDILTKLNNDTSGVREEQQKTFLMATRRSGHLGVPGSSIRHHRRHHQKGTNPVKSVLHG
ncbi:hypothetical protein MTO96_020916 [Rhipicephalus appendiculatus]